MKIFLIGLPGSGKSTLGKRLAGALETSFVDLDAEIERREGVAIPELFKKKKEAYFRAVESAELKIWTAAQESFVMATGGGAPCFHENMALMNRSGITIFLDVPAREIASRMSNTRIEDRPTLAKAGVDGLKDHIEFMRSNRIAFYREATHTFSGTQISMEEIMKTIKN